MTDEVLQFFGKISASVSHEINNIITAISEMSGLLVDLSINAEHGRPLDVQKTKKHSESILKQSQRGFAIIKRFNRFAHAVDKPLTTFNPIVHIENLIELCNRFAIIKNVKLDFEPPKESPLVKGNPFRLQHAIFIYLDAALNTIQKNGTINVFFDNTTDCLQIGLKIAHIEDIEETLMRIHIHDDILGEMHCQASINTVSESNTIEIQLTFPELLLEPVEHPGSLHNLR
jgi:signal transduction histidine kinase